MIRAGDGIRSRLASALAFEHGPTSAALAEFGIRPRKSGGRKKKAGPPPSPTPAPTPHPPPEATPAPAGGGVGTAK
jgi:hypothetical protein